MRNPLTRYKKFLLPGIIATFLFSACSGSISSQNPPLNFNGNCTATGGVAPTLTCTGSSSSKPTPNPGASTLATTMPSSAPVTLPSSIPTPIGLASMTAGGGQCTDGTTPVTNAPPGICMGTDNTGKAVFTYEVGGIAKTLYIFNKDSDSGQQNFTHCPYDNGGTDNIGCDTGIQNAGTNGGAHADPNGGFWPPVLMTAQSTMDAMNDTWASFNRAPQILSSDTDPDANMQQISCNGHPIYTYTADTAALQAKGDGIQSYDNKWVVLTNPCEAPLAMP